MLRSKEAFYSIKWDFRNWENIFYFHRKNTFCVPPPKQFSKVNCQVHAAEQQQQQADKDNQCGKGGQLSLTGNCLTAIKLLIPIPL